MGKEHTDVRTVLGKIVAGRGLPWSTAQRGKLWVDCGYVLCLFQEVVDRCREVELVGQEVKQSCLNQKVPNGLG